MNKTKVGCQTIGCSVTSCRYNDQGNYCELSRVQIEPCHKKHSDASDESLCGSYEMK